MQIGSMITAPTQPAFRTPTLRRMSSLNPLRDTRARASAQTLTCSDLDEKTNCSFRNRIQTRTHLSNLDRLLQKGPPTPLPDPTEADLFKSHPESRGKGTFDGFNLAGLWQGSKKGEEMSPRHLHKLQRLLSKSQEYSPRNILGRRWKEYHGSNDWDGLLDPLDENLRREVVRYGEFVQAAYQAFHSNPATSESDLASSRYVELPDRSYKVTKSLYATSSVGLPGWVDDVAPDLGWMTQRSSWIGYVAVCDDKREIARMGRRDIVIALRGTATCLEWAENFRAKLVEVAADVEQSEAADPKAECGFWSLYKTPGTHFASLSTAIIEEVRRLLDQYKGEDLSITVTGHSLGAALALLAANEISTCAPHVPPIAVFSFGGPRVGNRGFGDAVNRNGVKVLRIVNAQDMITRVPGVPHVPDDAPWAYSHVGSELRVDNRSSPYLKPNADVACCHDLEAYLHLVDGFLASNRPFRPNAKRSLVRLLHEQGSNMKKLYIKKGLKLNLEGLRNVTPSCMPSPS